MSEILARVATTGTVKQGGSTVIITREAIESIPKQIAGDQAIPIKIDHDPFCLPIGKIEEAWVEPYGEEYAVVARIHTEDTYSAVTHRRSGVEFVQLGFEDNPKPFIVRRHGEIIEEGQDTLSVDLANFTNSQDYTAFTGDVSLIDDNITCSDGIQRHSLGPEPLLQFALSALSNPEISAALAVGVWVIRRVEKFVRYTVDETLRKTADEISDSLSMKMKNILRKYVGHRSQDDRASITQIVIPGKLELVLLVKTEIDEEFPTIDLKKLVGEMEKYGDMLQEADSATFARVGINDWELQYLTTRSGKVIGTLKCYERTNEVIQRMKQNSEDISSGD